MTALLLSRGRWTRNFAIGLLTAELAIALAADFDGWLVAALITTCLALAGLSGPWLKGWIRERPAAGAPGVEPILVSDLADAFNREAFSTDSAPGQRDERSDGDAS